MKKIILMVLLLTSSQVVMAVNWVYVGNTSKLNLYIDYDSATLKNFDGGRGNYINAWVKAKYNQAQKLSNNSYYWENTMLGYYDCKNNKYNGNNVIWYDKAGNVVLQINPYVSTNSSNNWDLALPDSAGLAQLRLVCSWFGM